MSMLKCATFTVLPNPCFARNSCGVRSASFVEWKALEGAQKGIAPFTEFIENDFLAVEVRPWHLLDKTTNREENQAPSWRFLALVWDVCLYAQSSYVAASVALAGGLSVRKSIEA
ncbi:unnamed protein product [Clonostachys solani]|uniref:Uncharacterized protein n=1 Tax=Clonostachys solani TaxID=160281 RepID=A0A9N9ZGM0_9HYPO|nr:unnamed protein product [Clonostachys solani]